jgi:hypothetical protein
VLLFLLKMLPWTSRFLRQILALQPGYYLCKTQSIVNKECCNRISLREAMFCHSTTNSAGDHTQVISHSEFTTVTRHIPGLLFIYAFLTFLFFLSFLSFHLFFSFFFSSLFSYYVLSFYSLLSSTFSFVFWVRHVTPCTMYIFLIMILISNQRHVFLISVTKPRRYVPKNSYLWCLNHLCPYYLMSTRFRYS